MIFIFKSRCVDDSDEIRFALVLGGADYSVEVYGNFQDEGNAFIQKKTKALILVESPTGTPLVIHDTRSCTSHNVPTVPYIAYGPQAAYLNGYLYYCGGWYGGNRYSKYE